MRITLLRLLKTEEEEEAEEEEEKKGQEEEQAERKKPCLKQPQQQPLPHWHRPLRGKSQRSLRTPWEGSSLSLLSFAAHGMYVPRLTQLQ